MVVEHNLMTDDLLRQIIAVGRVDLLVGAPPIDHPGDAADLVRAVRACFRTHFPRLRVALLHVDQSRPPGVPSLVHRFWEEEPLRGGLRTTHLMTTTMSPGDDHSTSARVILAAADLLQATAVVVLAPEAGDPSPERIAKLAAPLRDGEVDFLAPVHPRAADTGLLVTQLLRPLTRALYGYDLREPLVPEFGASARLANYCSGLDFEIDRGRWQTHYWISAEALAQRFVIKQLPLGPRRTVASRTSAGLPAVFQRVLTSTFLSIEATSDAWRERPVMDAEPAAPAGELEPGIEISNGEAMLDTFEQDVHNLNEILNRILSPDTHRALKDAAAGHDARAGLPGPLWATIVGECLLAHHHNIILREHTVQALLPLYLARTGTFLREHAASPPGDLETALQELCEEFEKIKPRIIDRWTKPALR